MLLSTLALVAVTAALVGDARSVGSDAGSEGSDAGPAAHLLDGSSGPSMPIVAGGSLGGFEPLGGLSLPLTGARAGDPGLMSAYTARVEASRVLRAGLATASQVPDDPRPPVIARYAGLDLRLPGHKVMASGFHEAATSNGLPMEPVGNALRNLNATKFEIPEDSDTAGTAYLIMSSRGRPTPATSALDVLMPRDEPVLSPVTGVVADVREILVEQRHRDLRIELRPDGFPELRVVIVHLDGVQVAAGDRVEAGVTVLAETSRQFPFLSQIDNLTFPDLYPHIHLEVQPRDAPRPGGTHAQIDPPPPPAPDDAGSVED